MHESALIVLCVLLLFFGVVFAEREHGEVDAEFMHKAEHPSHGRAGQSDLQEELYQVGERIVPVARRDLIHAKFVYEHYLEQLALERLRSVKNVEHLIEWRIEDLSTELEIAMSGEANLKRKMVTEEAAARIYMLKEKHKLASAKIRVKELEEELTRERAVLSRERSTSKGERISAAKKIVIKLDEIKLILVELRASEHKLKDVMAKAESGEKKRLKELSASSAKEAELSLALRKSRGAVKRESEALAKYARLYKLKVTAYELGQRRLAQVLLHSKKMREARINSLMGAKAKEFSVQKSLRQMKARSLRERERLENYKKKEAMELSRLRAREFRQRKSLQSERLKQKRDIRELSKEIIEMRRLNAESREVTHRKTRVVSLQKQLDGEEAILARKSTQLERLRTEDNLDMKKEIAKESDLSDKLRHEKIRVAGTSRTLNRMKAQEAREVKRAHKEEVQFLEKAEKEKKKMKRLSVGINHEREEERKLLHSLKRKSDDVAKESDEFRAEAQEYQDVLNRIAALKVKERASVKAIETKETSLLRAFHQVNGELLQTRKHERATHVASASKLEATHGKLVRTSERLKEERTKEAEDRAEEEKLMKLHKHNKAWYLHKAHRLQHERAFAVEDLHKEEVHQAQITRKYASMLTRLAEELSRQRKKDIASSKRRQDQETKSLNKIVTREHHLTKLLNTLGKLRHVFRKLRHDKVQWARQIKAMTKRKLRDLKKLQHVTAKKLRMEKFAARVKQLISSRLRRDDSELKDLRNKLRNERARMLGETALYLQNNKVEVSNAGAAMKAERAVQQTLSKQIKHAFDLKARQILISQSETQQEIQAKQVIDALKEAVQKGKRQISAQAQAIKEENAGMAAKLNSEKGRLIKEVKALHQYQRKEAKYLEQAKIKGGNLMHIIAEGKLRLARAARAISRDSAEWRKKLVRVLGHARALKRRQDFRRDQAERAELARRMHAKENRIEGKLQHSIAVRLSMLKKKREQLVYEARKESNANRAEKLKQAQVVAERILVIKHAKALQRERAKVRTQMAVNQLIGHTLKGAMLQLVKEHHSSRRRDARIMAVLKGGRAVARLVNELNFERNKFLHLLKALGREQAFLAEEVNKEHIALVDVDRKLARGRAEDAEKLKHEAHEAMLALVRRKHEEARIKMFERKIVKLEKAIRKTLTTERHLKKWLARATQKFKGQKTQESILAKKIQDVSEQAAKEAHMLNHTREQKLQVEGALHDLISQLKAEGRRLASTARAFKREAARVAEELRRKTKRHVHDVMMREREEREMANDMARAQAWDQRLLRKFVAQQARAARAAVALAHGKVHSAEKLANAIRLVKLLRRRKDNIRRMADMSRLVRLNKAQQAKLRKKYTHEMSILSKSLAKTSTNVEIGKSNYLKEIHKERAQRAHENQVRKILFERLAKVLLRYESGVKAEAVESGAKTRSLKQETSQVAQKITEGRVQRLRHSTALRREKIKFMKELFEIKVIAQNMKGVDAKLEKELKYAKKRNVEYASKLKSLVARLKGKMSGNKELAQVHTTQRRRFASETKREAEQKAKLAVMLKTLNAKLGRERRHNTALAKHLKTEEVKVSRELEGEKAQEAMHSAVLKRERASLAKEGIENEASSAHVMKERRYLATLRKDGLEQKKADDRAFGKAKLEGAKHVHLEGEKVAHVLRRLHTAGKRLRHISKLVSHSGVLVAHASLNLKRNRIEWQRRLGMWRQKHARFMHDVARKQGVLIHHMERLQGHSLTSIQKLKAELASKQKNEKARTAKEAAGIAVKLAALTKYYQRMKKNAAHLLERGRQQHALRLKQMKVRETRILAGIAKQRLHVINALKRENVHSVQHLSQVNSTMAKRLEKEKVRRAKEHALATRMSNELKNAKATIVEIVKKNRTETQTFKSEKEKDALKLHKAVERVTQTRHALEESKKRTKETLKHENAVQARKLGIEKAILERHREQESAKIRHEHRELKELKTKLRMLKKWSVKQAHELKKIMEKETKEQDTAISVYGNLVRLFQMAALRKVENAKQFHVSKTKILRRSGVEKGKAISKLLRSKRKEALARHDNAEKINSILHRKTQRQTLLNELRRLKREKFHIHRVLKSARKTLQKVNKHSWKVRGQLRKALQEVSKKQMEVKHTKLVAKKLFHVLEKDEKDIADALRRKHAILTHNLTMLKHIHSQELQFRSKRSADWYEFNKLKARLAREKKNPIFKKRGMLAHELAREKKRMEKLRAVINGIRSRFNQVAQKVKRTKAKVAQIKEKIVKEKEHIKKDVRESRSNILKLHQKKKKKAQLLERAHGLSERNAHEQTKIQKFKERKLQSEKMLGHEHVKLRNVIKMLAKGHKAISEIQKEKKAMTLSEEKKMKKMVGNLKKLQLFISKRKAGTAGKIKNITDMTGKIMKYTAKATADELRVRKLRAEFVNNAKVLALLRLVEKEVKVFKAGNKAKAKLAFMNREDNNLQTEGENLQNKIDNMQDAMYGQSDQFDTKLENLRGQASTLQTTIQNEIWKRQALERKLAALKAQLKTLSHDQK